MTTKPTKDWPAIFSGLKVSRFPMEHRSCIDRSESRGAAAGEAVMAALTRLETIAMYAADRAEPHLDIALVGEEMEGARRSLERSLEAFTDPSQSTLVGPADTTSLGLGPDSVSVSSTEAALETIRAVRAARARLEAVVIDIESLHSRIDEALTVLGDHVACTYRPIRPQTCPMPPWDSVQAEYLSALQSGGVRLLHPHERLPTSACSILQ